MTVWGVAVSHKFSFLENSIACFGVHFNVKGAGAAVFASTVYDCADKISKREH